MTRLIVLVLGLICGHGVHTFHISLDLAPEQVMLMKRSLDFVNTAFGCDIVGLELDSTLKNVYDAGDHRNTLLVLKDVSREPGVSANAIAFTDDRFPVSGTGLGVHVAIDDIRSHPSMAFTFGSDPSKWSPLDWNLVRTIVHEIGHTLRLRDDQADAGSIMAGDERDTDQDPITSTEMTAFVGAIRTQGMSCQ